MGGRVPIVDDRGRSQASALRMLEANGHQVVGEASDGATAIDAVARLHPDIALLIPRRSQLDR